MYAEGHKVKGAPKLPLNMLDALREFDKDKGLKAAMGDEFSAAYLKMKHQEWNSFARISRNGRKTTRWISRGHDRRATWVQVNPCCSNTLKAIRFMISG